MEKENGHAGTKPSAIPFFVRDERGVVLAPGALLTDVASDRRVGTGSDWFPFVFDKGVFVDKSLLVREILTGSQVTLFCRPRRFGKTLAATMLQDFFECAPLADPVARARFERLSIWDADDGRWREHQGRYPVVALSLKGAEGASWEEMFPALASKIAVEFSRHSYVMQTDWDTSMRAKYERLTAESASWAELVDSLRFLTDALYRYHRQPCAVIIDEYDAPVTHAHEAGFYEQAIGFLRPWLSGGLKTNPALAFGVLTGVQRISKESIFSGLNNIDVNTPLNTRFDERFGFTPHEVAALASYCGHGDKVGEIQAWYDGYRFGSVDIYNPWSVLSYLAKGCVAQPYWVNTSGNSVLNQAFSHRDTTIVDGLLRLLEPGSSVDCTVDPNIAYGELDANPAAIWSVLYMGGYLTTDDTQRPEDPAERRSLRVPNTEVRSVFTHEVVDRARHDVGGFDRLDAMHAAVISGDVAVLTRQLEAVVGSSTSYYDLTSESACHMLVLGLLFGMTGYRDPRSNREAGYGRFDIQVCPRDGSSGLPVVTVEVKFMRPDEYVRLGEAASSRLTDLASQAVTQIAEKAYDCDGRVQGRGLVRWGIAFAGKHVALVCDRLDAAPDPLLGRP